MIRLFIALGLNVAAREVLWNAISGIGIRGQLTSMENYHLTLAFLGTREDAQISLIERIVADTASQNSPQELTVSGIGFWGRRENALLYATIAPAKPLFVLSDILRLLLEKAGETFDKKPLIPHITLARKADLTEANLDLQIPPITFKVKQLTLYNATRVEEVLRYQPVFEACFHREGKYA